MREFIQVDQRVFHQHLPHGRGAGQGLDSIVIYKHDGVGQLPHIVEPLVGEARLPGRGGDASDEREQYQNQRRYRDLVPADELGDPVYARGRPGHHRIPRNVQAEVFA